MQKYISIIAGIVASLAVLIYALFVGNELFFGVIAVGVITAATYLWTRERREHALVVTILGGVLSSAVFIGKLDFVLLAVGVTGIAYLGWSQTRQRGSVS